MDTSLQKRPLGRPMKYNKLLVLLGDDELYTPASIALFAVTCGFVEEGRADKMRMEKQRIRIALGRFSNNHAFPDEGDGMLRLPGQAPTPAWFGWRWKAAADK